MLVLALQARGKLGNGGQWSPDDWYKSGSYSKVEDDLLRSEWSQQLKELKGLPPPPPKPEEVFGKEPIVIEGLETVESQEHAFVDQTPLGIHQ